MSKAKAASQHPAAMPDWTSHAMALFATILIAAGIVALVGANWSEFGRWPRFLILASGTLFCLVGAAWLSGFDDMRSSLFKHMAAAMGTVLAGVSAALVGQAWQMPLEWNGVLATAAATGLAAAIVFRSTPTAWISMAAMIAWAATSAWGRSKFGEGLPASVAPSSLAFIVVALAGICTDRIRAHSGTFFLLILLGVVAYAPVPLEGLLGGRLLVIGPITVAACLAMLFASYGRERDARGITDAAIVATILAIALSSMDFGFTRDQYRTGPSGLLTWSTTFLTPMALCATAVAAYAWWRREASPSIMSMGFVVLALLVQMLAARHRYGFVSQSTWTLFGQVLPLLLISIAAMKSSRGKATILAAVTLLCILAFQLWRAKVLSEVGIVCLLAGVGLSSVLWLVPRMGRSLTVGGRELPLDASRIVPAALVAVPLLATGYLAVLAVGGMPSQVFREVTYAWSLSGNSLTIACAAVIAAAALSGRLKPILSDVRSFVPALPVPSHYVTFTLAALLACSALYPSLSLAVGRDRILSRGVEVVLAVETRDPRSLFRGDYSKLVYKIGRLDGTPVEGGVASVCDPARLASHASACIATGRDVYTILERTPEGVHAVRAVSFERPQPGSLFIRGKLSGTTVFPRGRLRGPGRPPCEAEACINGSATYGIETWFGREGLPAQLDRAARADVRVVVRVSPSGDAVIDKVTVENVELAPTR